MAVCAKAVLQSDGSYLLGLDPSVTDPTTCAYVVETGSESLMGSIASLSVDDALTISSYVVGFWAFCWGVRQLILILSNSWGETNEID